MRPNLPNVDFLGATEGRFSPLVVGELCGASLVAGTEGEVASAFSDTLSDALSEAIDEVDAVAEFCLTSNFSGSRCVSALALGSLAAIAMIW